MLLIVSIAFVAHIQTSSADCSLFVRSPWSFIVFNKAFTGFTEQHITKQIRFLLCKKVKQTRDTYLQ